MIKNNLNDFLNLLFDVGDWSCFDDSLFGTKISRYPKEKDIFFSINPLEPFQDFKPEKPHHRANLGRRADHNVVKFRNFLLEIDDMGMDEQIQYITSKIPVSSIVYSGGKSCHFIISLETPVKNKEDYVKLAKRLHKLFPKADPTTKNPSRFSRLPFRQRNDTGKMQELLYLGKRINYDTLDKILPEVENVIPIRNLDNPNTREYVAAELVAAYLNPEQTMLNKNIHGRNNFFFWLGCRMRDLSYDKDRQISIVTKAYENLKNKSEFSYKEALFAARLN